MHHMMLAVALAATAAGATPEIPAEARTFQLVHASLDDLERIVTIIEENRTDVCTYLHDQPIGAIKQSCERMRSAEAMFRSTLSHATASAERLFFGLFDPMIVCAQPKILRKIHDEFITCANNRLADVVAALPEILNAHTDLIELFNEYQGDGVAATYVKNLLANRIERMGRVADALDARLAAIRTSLKAHRTEPTPPYTSPSTCRDL